MLLAQGSEGQKWIGRLPGPDRQGNSSISGDTSNDRQDDNRSINITQSEDTPNIYARNGPTQTGDEAAGEWSWWCQGGVSGASLFERECDKAAKRVGRLFDAPQLRKAGTNAVQRR